MRHFLIGIIIILNYACTTLETDKGKPSGATRIIVCGKVLNHKPDIDSIELSIARLGMDSKEMATNVSANGEFQFEFEYTIPTCVWLTYKKNFQIGIKPGDSIYIEFDGASTDRREILQTAKFKADRALFNKQTALFRADYFGSKVYNDIEREERAIKIYEPADYKVYADSVEQERQLIFDDFIATHSPTQEVRQWVKVYLQREYFSALTGYPASHRRALVLQESEWGVPVTYYDYLKQFERLTENDLVNATLITATSDDFLYRDWQSAKEKSKALFDNPSTPQYVKDSLVLYNVGELTNDPLLKEIELTLCVYFELAQLNVDYFSRNRMFIETNIKQPYLIEPLLEKYDQAVLILEQQASAKHANTKNGDSTNSSLLNSVINNNKGKVIYVDVWATWCKPCLEEFPYSKKLHQEFKDVEFVYFCVDSEEQKYKKVREEHNIKGQHYFLDSKQSGGFMENMRINDIPQYILIDKQGSIISKGGQDRPSADHTKQKIEELLAN